MFSLIKSAIKATAIGGILATTVFAATIARAEEKPMVIGVVTPFQSNAWQKAFLSSMDWATTELAAQKKPVELKIVDAAGDVQVQIQQINNLTLQGVDFIILEPLSDTALNGAIDNAMDAGIPVMTVALGAVTNPRPFDLETDQGQLYGAGVDYLSGRVNGKGKALVIRGLAGNAAEKGINDSITAALKKHPDIEVVSEIYGDWNQTTVQQRVTAVLPSLPQIDLILAQGESAFGASQAFVAAGRAVPPMIYGINGADMNMLKKLNKESGYESRVMQEDPGIGGVALNVAVAALSGTELPKKMLVPFANLSVEDVNKLYPEIADNSSGYGKHGYQWTLDNVIAPAK